MPAISHLKGHKKRKLEGRRHFEEMCIWQTQGGQQTHWHFPLSPSAGADCSSSSNLVPVPQFRPKQWEDGKIKQTDLCGATKRYGGVQMGGGTETAGWQVSGGQCGSLQVLEEGPSVPSIQLKRWAAFQLAESSLTSSTRLFCWHYWWLWRHSGKDDVKEDGSDRKILFFTFLLKLQGDLGIVVYVFSPSYLRGFGKRIAWAQGFEISLGNIVKVHLKKVCERDMQV